MPEVNEIRDLYLAVGIGGMSFLVLVFVLYFLLKSIIPAISGLKDLVVALRQDNAVNTKAIEEFAKSNDNVATALNLVSVSMARVETGMEKVEKEIEEKIGRAHV